MFELITESPTYGDSTSKYIVLLDNTHTVYEFTLEVLKRINEWGDIKIKHNDELLTNYKLEYKNGEIKSSNIPSDFLKSKIVSAVCYGGYSRMDYVLDLTNT